LDIDLLAFLSPLISVFIFYVYEKLSSTNKSAVKNRIRTILGIESVNLILGVLLSAIVLIPLVFLLAPLQIFSFSNLPVPMFVSFILSFLFLDFINYLQHRLHHKIPFLWKLHRLHHSDQHMDAFTTILHHPLEIVSAFILTVSFAVIFDVPVIVLVVYALVSGLHSGFTHTKKMLPDHLDRYIRYVLITPNTHRVHHSLNMNEGNSNFGIVFIFWDMLFNTLTLKPKSSLIELPLGIGKSQQPKNIQFLTFIKNPFI
jgi:sterol desaturase/sphingolipid hydroxylase (fatty acid hydroxylase superfamily)